MNKNETQNIEFKSNWDDKYLKVVAAFANSEGGTLVIGKDDQGRPIPVKNIRKKMEDIPNKIKSRLGVIPSVNLEKENDREFIEIKINPVIHPVPYRGRFYLRAGSTVQEVSGTELTRFLLARSGKSWDSLPSNAEIDTIEPATFERFVKLAKDRLPEISHEDDVEKTLKNMDLIVEGRLSNAAVLLFGDRPQKYIISAGARVGRFKTDVDILDTVEAFGNLFTQFDRLLEAIKKHMDVKFEINGIEREDVWDYPLEAIREAVINALIHRDYLSTADIQIRVYDDKMKIWNPGKLPEEIPVEALKQDHESIPRNKLLAYAFYYAGWIEKWGSGTKRIVDLCVKKGLPEPDFNEESGGLAVYFYKDIYNEENLKRLGLNERQIKAVMYVKENGRIGNKEYRDLTGISRQMAFVDLKDLVEKGLLSKTEEQGPKAAYELTNN